MNNECRLTDATGLIVAVGTRDQMMSSLKRHSPDGAYAVVGPGIDAKFYKHGGIVYPAGGHIDSQAIPARTPDECVAVFGLATKLNDVRDGVIDDEFMRDLERMGEHTQRPQPTTAVPKPFLFDRLRAEGVATVWVRYDGYGDSGCVESIAALGPGGGELELSPDLLDSVEEYVFDRLPDGWELDEGSFGRIEFDVPGGRVKYNHSQKYTEITNVKWEE